MTDATIPVPPWYQSRTVWATLATAVLNIAASAGYKISPDFANSLPDVLLNIASLVGFGCTIWLHMKSKQSVTKAAISATPATPSTPATGA
jgi:hypothetical protein